MSTFGVTSYNSNLTPPGLKKDARVSLDILGILDKKGL